MCEADTSPNWQELLHKAVKATNCAEVARELGVSRTAVSLLINGKYAGDTRRMAERILNRFGRTLCPCTGRRMSVAECRQTAATMPTSSPGALRLWRACQQCEHKGEHHV